MSLIDHSTAEADLVRMLLSRNGSRTCITTVDGEPMRVRQVEIADLPSAVECDYYATIRGVGLSADAGTYSFFSTEISTVEDTDSGAIIYARTTQ